MVENTGGGMNKMEWCNHEFSALVTEEMKSWLNTFGIEDREGGC